MPTGTVKWFNNAKGFGFILPDEGNEDVFAHYSAIDMDGYRTLKAGQAVEFDISQGDKGLHAVNIRLAEATTEAQSTENAQNNANSDTSSADQTVNSAAEIPETEGA